MKFVIIGILKTLVLNMKSTSLATSVSETYLCNGCQDLMQKAMSFNNVAIVYVKGHAYRIHFWYMCKNDVINVRNNSNLADKSGVLYIFFYYKLFLLYIKMSENTDLTYYQRNRDVMLNKAKDYYKNDKERLRGQARDKYRNLSEEKKHKKKNMGKIDTTICLKKRSKD